MYIMRCSDEEGFQQGQLSRYGNIELSPSAGVLNYGQVKLPLLFPFSLRGLVWYFCHSPFTFLIRGCLRVQKRIGEKMDASFYFAQIRMPSECRLALKECACFHHLLSNLSTLSSKLHWLIDVG